MEQGIKTTDVCKIMKNVFFFMFTPEIAYQTTTYDATFFIKL